MVRNSLIMLLRVTKMIKVYYLKQNTAQDIIQKILKKLHLGI